jgi:hypothetical protein
MRSFSGWVAEVQLHLRRPSALIACPPEAVPQAGQYLLAVDEEAIQATPLFLAGDWRQGFLAAPPCPDLWLPGTSLSLYGPFGHGFHLPADIQRLALIGLGDTNARLLPLGTNSQIENINITLFSDAPFTKLPPSMEAYPLKDLQESISWADFIAIDVPLENLEKMAESLRISFPGVAALRGQVLIQTSMPCSGVGDCGVCAVKIGRSWKFTCKDGPVFELDLVLKGVGW